MPIDVSYLESITEVAKACRTAAACRDLCADLKAQGAGDYLSLVDALEADIARTGLYLSDPEACAVVGIPHSTCRQRRGEGRYPKPDRLPANRIAMNRFVIWAYSIQISARNDLGLTEPMEAA